MILQFYNKIKIFEIKLLKKINIYKITLDMKVENDLTKKFSEIKNQIKKSVKDYIDNSFLIITKNKQEITVKDLEKWKNNISININNEIDKLFETNLNNKEPDKKPEQIKENSVKKEYKIENNSALNIIIPKDIQEENKEITRNFQNEAYNYMNANEKVENENVASFLKKVAIISRISYKNSKNLHKIMKDKYLKTIGDKTPKEDETLQKEFSAWIKNLEKEKGKKEYEIYLSQIKLFENEKNNNEEKYLLKLFLDLTTMYFHCNISFPLVEINFTKKEDFNSEAMIDFINRGKNRKVDFIILPSLFSNGNYIQNGKFWVFTFYKNTYRFGDSINNELSQFLEEDKKEKKNIKNTKSNYAMKVYCKTKNGIKHVTIETNFNIPKNSNYNFIFNIKNKTDNKVYKTKIKSMSFTLKNYYEIVDFKYLLENKIIISSKDIVNE